MILVILLEDLKPVTEILVKLPGKKYVFDGIILGLSFFFI